MSETNWSIYALAGAVVLAYAPHALYVVKIQSATGFRASNQAYVCSLSSLPSSIFLTGIHLQTPWKPRQAQEQALRVDGADPRARARRAREWRRGISDFCGGHGTSCHYR